MNTNSRNVTYSTVGDYQLPNLTLNQPRKPLGKYGRLRRTYLMNHRPVLYNTMLLNGSLYPHLMEVEQTAESRMQQTMEQLLKQDPAPDKAQNQLMWVQHMNSLKAQAEELVLTELIPKEQIVTKRYEKENAERKNHLQDLQTQRNKAEKDLLALKTEVLACIKGESVLPRETLAEMITAQEEKLTELENLCEAASEELEKTAELMDKVSRLYDELISYADLYDSANFEAKKMIVNQLIRRVDVYRGYQINISFNFDLTPYIEGE